MLRVRKLRSLRSINIVRASTIPSPQQQTQYQRLMPKKCNLIKNRAREMKLFCLFVCLFPENEYSHFHRKKEITCLVVVKKIVRLTIVQRTPLKFNLLCLVKINAVLLKQNCTSPLIGQQQQHSIHISIKWFVVLHGLQLYRCLCQARTKIHCIKTNFY